MDNQKHVLLVDDDSDFLESISGYLESEGLVTSLATDADGAIACVRRGNCDLAILDVMLGLDNGFALCRDISKISDIPIIFLSGRIEDTEKILGLELGADDYVTKPVNPRELLARIRSVLRRRDPKPVMQTDELLRAANVVFGGWTLDAINQEIVREDGTKLDLSTGEARLLQVFVNHPNEVLSRDQLSAITKGRQIDPLDRRIDNYISRIRKKIEIDPQKPQLLKTHWGAGYVLCCDISEEN